MSNGVVIIGGGQAGVQVAADLRQRGFADDITILGSEPAVPYQRPPLSKAYLLGKQELSQLFLRKPEFYAKKNVSLKLGTRVVEAVKTATGGYVTTHDGTRYPFRYLVVATGATACKPHIPGIDASNVHCMRTLEDADALRETLDQVDKVVVLGGGFIGLEAAAVLNSLGKRVDLIVRGNRLLKRAVSDTIATFFLDAHRRRGINVRLANDVREIVANSKGKATGVKLQNGEFIAADTVLAGLGVSRDNSLARQLGLQWQNGIVVDENSRTNVQDVFAVGDCAVYAHPLSGSTERSCFESVQNAVDQAKVAAAAITGDASLRYDMTPWFWSDQDNLKLQIAGLFERADESIVRGDPASESFCVLHFSAGEFVAIEAVNRPQDFALGRKALNTGANILQVDGIENLATPLKQLLVQPQTVTV
jgi:3-phenylpropionate/trans-cinnamate dioxygenase ferredoxin reductase subunit